MKGRGLGMLLCLLASACGEQAVGSDPDVFFPTHASTDVPNAQAFGTLIRSRDCILLRESTQPSDLLLLWPEGFSFQAGTVLDGSTPVAAIGDRVQLGGGEVTPEVATDLIDQKIPERCGDPTPWVVSDIGRSDPSVESS
jgi:hypothetical protein